MNHHNEYKLSFNPRGIVKKSRANKPSLFPQQRHHQYQPQHQPISYPQYQQQYQYPSQEYSYPQATPPHKILNFNPTKGQTSNSRFSSKRQQEQMIQNQQQKRKQILSRVKKLQDKVLPLLQNDLGDVQNGNDSGWKQKVDLKLVRIQASLENTFKEWRVTLERRFARMEQQMEEKYQMLMRFSKEQ